MSPKKKTSSRTKPQTQKPSLIPESREKQLINAAVNLAEKQLNDGTASPSVINHYLKMASTREAMELDILTKQAELITAKADSIVSGKKTEELTKDAIAAMKSYQSNSN